MGNSHKNESGKRVAGGVRERMRTVAKEALSTATAKGGIAVAETRSGLQGVAEMTGHLHRLGADLRP